MQPQRAEQVHTGALVQFDIQRLSMQSRPIYINGGGGGVDVQVVDAMLRSTIEALSHAGSSEADDLTTALELIERLTLKRNENLATARHALAQYERARESNDTADAGEQLETLRLCLEPIAKVIRY